MHRETHTGLQIQTSWHWESKIIFVEILKFSQVLTKILAGVINVKPSLMDVMFLLYLHAKPLLQSMRTDFCLF